jgi:hypothetical protein
MGGVQTETRATAERKRTELPLHQTARLYAKYLQEWNGSQDYQRPWEGLLCEAKKTKINDINLTATGFKYYVFGHYPSPCLI